MKIQLGELHAQIGTPLDGRCGVLDHCANAIDMVVVFACAQHILHHQIDAVLDTGLFLQRRTYSGHVSSVEG